MQDRFSEYVSLGHNCEGAFQIRRVLGQDSASFFSWNITPTSALESLIRTQFAGILRRENISPHGDGSLLNDSAHGYKFHSPFDRIELFNDPNFEEKFVNHKEKTSHLIRKFLRERGREEATAYFYKAEESTDPAVLRSDLTKVRDLLVNIHGVSKFVLVVLQDVKRKEGPWDDFYLRNRYLNRLSPWHDATDGHVQSWDKVFSEFPHKDGLRLAGY